jgi:FG-GAP-like repeat
MRITTSLALAVLGAGVALFVHCATLEAIPEGTCGNGVVESATEDCDPLNVDDAGADAGVDAGDAGGPRFCRKNGDPFACRLDCSESNKCPTGWGCDVSTKICREPLVGDAQAPRFEAVEIDALERTGAVRVALADLDGDRRLDVLARGRVGDDNTTRTRIHYFTDRGTLAQSLVVPFSMAGPVIYEEKGADPDEPGSSLLFAGIGVGILEGSKARDLKTKILPAFVAPPEFTVLNVGVGFLPPGESPSANPSVLYVVARSDKALLFNSLAFAGDDAAMTSDGKKAFEASLPLSSELRQFQMFGGSPSRPLSFAGSTCTFVALAPTPGDQLYLLSVPNPNLDPKFAACRRPELKVVPLPDKSSAFSWVFSGPNPALASEQNPDPQSRDSILMLKRIETQNQNRSLLDVWNWGVFGSPVAPKLPEIAFPNNDVEDVLGFEFFAPDTPSLILPSGIAQAPESLEFDAGVASPADGGTRDASQDAAPRAKRTLSKFDSLSYGRRSGKWSVVVTGDFNGDGHKDLVGASGATLADQSNTDLDVLLGDGNGRFASSVVQTGGAVTHLAAGDYDGDGVDDVAFAENNEGKSQVQVLYGSRSGGLSAVTSLGSVSQLVALRNGGIGDLATETYAPGRPLAPKLVIVTERGAAIAVGTGERSMLAPLYFQRGGRFDRLADRLVGSAAIDGIFDDGKRMLISAAAAASNTDGSKLGGISLFTSVYVDDKSLTPPVLAVQDRAPRGLFLLGKRKLPAKPAAPGASEAPEAPEAAFGIEERQSSFELFELGVSKVPDLEMPNLNLRKLSLTTVGSVVVSQPEPDMGAGKPVVEGKPDFQLGAFDVNGDGRDEAIVASHRLSPQGKVENASVQIFRAEANGALRKDPVVFNGKVGFAFLHFIETSVAGKVTQVRRLILVDTKGMVSRVDWNGFEPSESKVVALNQPKADGLVTGLAAGDITGDGVDDLVIVEAGQLHILKGATRLP